jgi:DNA-binding response OmpR family regulator
VAVRVLVVDDADAMRRAVRRVLTDSGYEVDVAGTLAEARGMHPGKYAAVLVDARLGNERGMDLVEELCAQDPAATGRCLLMTGGAIGMIPQGLAYLAKPFEPGELIKAVRALHHPHTVAAPGRWPEAAPDSGAPSSAAAPGESQPAAGTSRGGKLLELTRRLRDRERDEQADFLHDGPLQELAAATLDLHMMRQSAPAATAQSIDTVLQRLDIAARSLRWLVEGTGALRVPETRLAVCLQQRTAWLLARPITVSTGPWPVGADAIDALAITDVVELMLLAMADAGPCARAHVAVRTEQDLTRIELTLTRAAEDGQALGDPATARALLAELASALLADADIELGEQQWRALITLRRHEKEILTEPAASPPPGRLVLAAIGKRMEQVGLHVEISVPPVCCHQVCSAARTRSSLTATRPSRVSQRAGRGERRRRAGGKRLPAAAGPDPAPVPHRPAPSQARPTAIAARRARPPNTRAREPVWMMGPLSPKIWAEMRSRGGTLACCCCAARRRPSTRAATANVRRASAATGEVAVSVASGTP